MEGASNTTETDDVPQKDSSDTTENTDMGGCQDKSSLPKNERPEKYQWEQDVLDGTVMKDGKISHSAIVSFKDAELRAAAPNDFLPNKKGLVNIVEALKGNTAGLATELIDLGSGSRICTPGKIDDGKAIYGTDGQGGGCTVFKSKECVLILLYPSGPNHAARMAIEVAEYMEEQGH